MSVPEKCVFAPMPRRITKMDMWMAVIGLASLALLVFAASHTNG